MERDALDLAREPRRADGRAPLAAQREIRLSRTDYGSRIELWAQYPAGWICVGSLVYKIGPIPGGYRLPGLDANAPLLVQDRPGGAPHPGPAGLPNLFIITGFNSNFQHLVKGVGGALLCHAAKIADVRGCPFVTVLSGINHEVYAAFEFELVDPIGETWCIDVEALKRRTKKYETPTTGLDWA